MPCAEIIIQHMEHRTVFANHIMRAHLRARKRKGFQRLVAAILCGMVNDNKIRFPQTEVGGAHPFR